MSSMFPKRLQDLQPFFTEWTLDDNLAEGGFGQVFRIKREHGERRYYAALKWIEVVFDEGTTNELRLKGLTDEEIKLHYEKVKESSEKEIDFMMTLNGHPNVVQIHDYCTIERSDQKGYDILIRMELLTPLLQHLKSNVTVNDVRKMGIDICKALEVCAAHNYVHRDIKPANIFVNEHGDFKLGDFGIGRNLQRAKSSLNPYAATLDYMSPEMVHAPSEVDTLSDQYQLGLVMYQLLNVYCLPFVSPVRSVITNSEAEHAALLERLQAGTIPPPQQGGSQLINAVIKACQFDKKKRHASPTVFREALEKAGNERENFDTLLCGKREPVVRPMNNVPVFQPEKDNQSDENDDNDEQFDMGFIIKIAVAIVLVITLVVFCIIVGGNNDGPNGPTDTPTPIPTPTPTSTPTVEPIAAVTPTIAPELTPTSTPAPEQTSASIEKGDRVQIGHYEQDGNRNNGLEPVTWIVLDVKPHQDKALVLSEYILDVQYFYPSDIRVAKNWEESYVREWLNGSFKNECFSSNDIQHIHNTELNTNYVGTVIQTTDKLFLLDVEEVYQYLSSGQRSAQLSAYGRSIVDDAMVQDGAGHWMLRDSTNDKKMMNAVLPDGMTHEQIANTNSPGYGIRPAMWIDLSFIQP